MTDTENYRRAQLAMAELKAAVLAVVIKGGPEGVRNVDVGKTLGIYGGHVGHVGHISRTLLEILQNEGLVEQVEKRWRKV